MSEVIKETISNMTSPNKVLSLYRFALGKFKFCGTFDIILSVMETFDMIDIQNKMFPVNSKSNTNKKIINDNDNDNDKDNDTTTTNDNDMKCFNVRNMPQEAMSVRRGGSLCGVLNASCCAIIFTSD